ncbi:MAG TPA: DUF5916 domain-containing protein [Longimicrobiales bacterium]|nr:DUF5916 domain-containing protein [Longimicrobiales bacterium]
MIDAAPPTTRLARRPFACLERRLSLVLLFMLAAPIAGQQSGTAPAGDQEAQAARREARPLPEGRRTMTAVRLRPDERIELDGILDEAVWQRAEPATDFIQQDPDFGGTPTERTEVRIVFTSESLYMGVTAFDSEPDRLLGNTMKRDEFLRADDRFMWTMDTFLDQQTGYFFEMNPSGLMADALMIAGGGNERSWDGIWDAQVRRSEIGWVLEIEIPFRTLNFDPAAPAWGINFQRTIRRKNEENLWTGHERNQGLRRMSNAGLLLGISDVSQGHGLDVKPYAVATTLDAPGAAPPRDWDRNGDVGVDLFYNITPDLRANLTVNTDFAQTEVDQRLVNLTRFPLRYPEKRDFFLDGAPFFSFASEGVEPFFSRRIGLTAGVPQQVDGGTKLTGRAGAQDIGFLHVRTGEEGGGESPTVFGEDFTVLRVKRRVLTQSYFGTFFSRRAVRGDASDPDDLYTAGADFRLATSQFRGSDQLALSGFFLWNTNPTGSGEDFGYGAYVDYPNDRWVAGFGFTEIQPSLNPAIGFTPRRAFRRYNPRLTFGPRPDNHPLIRQLAFGASADLYTDLENRFVTRNIDIILIGVSFQSQESIGLRVIPSYERLERDFEVQEGVVLPEGSAYDFVRYQLNAGTANSRILAVDGTVEVGDFFSGDRRELVANLALRPRPGVVIYSQNEWNRVNLPEGRFDTRLHRLIADTQFSPWMYVVNNVQYDTVTDELGWQLRFRWTVSPGNDLYLVYAHNWIDDPTLGRFVTQDRQAAAKLVYTYRW